MLLFCSIHYVLKRNIDNDEINRENPDCLRVYVDWTRQRHIDGVSIV